jgi:hypothetical protein
MIKINFFRKLTKVACLDKGFEVVEKPMFEDLGQSDKNVACWDEYFVWNHIQYFLV